MPPFEQLEQTQYCVRIPTFGLDQPTLISKGVHVQQVMVATLPIKMHIANGLIVHGIDVSFQQPRRVNLYLQLGGESYGGSPNGGSPN